jgi:lipid A 3-O-deacylase
MGTAAMASTPRKHSLTVILRRVWLPAFLVSGLGAAADAQAYEVLAASGVFVQAGVAEQAQMLAAGAVWDWHWRRPLAGGELSGYWELSFGRWSSQREPGGKQSAWVTQFGITPVWRWHPREPTTHWFVEGGIGANLLAPIYRSRDKRFSTRFNFGDHLAVGWYLDAQRRHELALRVQHFSNAGIKRPNPGEDFVQLRYLGRF